MSTSGFDRCAASAEGLHRAGERAHLVLKPGGQYLVELGQCPERGGAGGRAVRATRAGEQRNRGGDRLLVVEKQQRQVLPRAELVAAADTLAGVHRIAERAQPLDITPYRARGDPEPVGELGAGPDLALLQQPEQWEVHWKHQLRARLEGLTDDECFWSPVPDAWSVRPRGSSTAPVQFGAGDFTVDFAFPQPVPAAFTTIAWPLGHVIVGMLAARNAAYFGAPAASYETWEYAGSAATALDQLETQLDVWLVGGPASATQGSRSRSVRGSPSPRCPWPAWYCTFTAS
jgi:hypothetical protein